MIFLLLWLRWIDLDRILGRSRRLLVRILDESGCVFVALISWEMIQYGTERGKGSEIEFYFKGYISQAALDGNNQTDNLASSLN